jgi:ATPase subunit of ABC transporter with duplicated ATPase domains
LLALILGDVSPDKGTIAIEKNATIRFLPQETAFQVQETLSAFVGGNDEPVSIAAMHSNIAFDFVELKLDAVLRDG